MVLSVLTSTAFLATLGWVLSMYAVYVEVRMHAKDPDEEFTALCDIKALSASCSKVFSLPQGRMLSYFGLVPEDSYLNVPNAALGLLYYTYLLILEQINFAVRRSADLAVLLPPVALTRTIVSCAFLSTVFLAYQLTFVVFELCVLCWTTHVINTSLMIRFVTRPCLFSSSASSEEGKKGQ